MKNNIPSFLIKIKKFLYLIIINEIANWITPIDHILCNVFFFEGNNSIRLVFNGYEISLDEMTQSFPLDMHQWYIEQGIAKPITEEAFYALIGSFKFNRKLVGTIIIISAKGKLHLMQHYLGRGFVLSKDTRYVNKFYFPSIKESLVQ